MNHATARGMGDGVCSPDYLAEFVRAQNDPHLKIHCIMVRVLGPTGYKVVARLIAPERGLPL